MSTKHHKPKTGNNAASQITRQDSETLVSSVLNHLNKELLKKASKMLCNADKSLSEQGDQAELNSSYGTILQLLRTHGGNIYNAFSMAINNEGNNDAAEADGISLVGQDEIEELVAVTTMYTNAMNTYGQEVSNLNTRLEHLEEITNSEIDKQRLDLKFICEAFKTSLSDTGMELEDKMLLFKLFDREVSSQLAGMYRSFNRQFIKAGVLPVISYKVDSDDNDNKDDDEGLKSDENKSADDGSCSVTEISSFLSKYMHGASAAEGKDIPESFKKVPTDKEYKNSYARADVMEALSKLQSDLLNKGGDAGVLDAEQIKRSIMADMGTSSGGVVTKQVNLLDQRSIDFVGMMFNEITNDESVSKITSNLLLRLQIPVIKVAMIDDEMFSSEDHPVRNTLDMVSQAGKGITAEDDDMYRKLEKIVEGILKDYDVNTASFESAVDELKTLIDAEEELAAENEKKEQRALIESHARDVVLTVLRHLLSSKQLPRNMQPLVLKHWSTLMLNQYVQHGKKSNLWMQSIMLLKLLLKCLQPIKSKAQWQMLSNNHEPLVEAVNDSLYETQQDKSEIDIQIETLKATFLEMLDEYGIKIAQEEKDANTESVESFDEISFPLEDVENDEDVSGVEEQDNIAREKIARLPSDIYPGVWCVVFNGDDKPVRRLKLSVILTEIAKLIFVDSRGIKVLEKDAGDFADELENDKSKLISDHSAFDRALGKVINNIAA